MSLIIRDDAKFLFKGCQALCEGFLRRAGSVEALARLVPCPSPALLSGPSAPLVM